MTETIRITDLKVEDGARIRISYSIEDGGVSHNGQLSVPDIGRVKQALYHLLVKYQDEKQLKKELYKLIGEAYTKEQLKKYAWSK